MLASRLDLMAKARKSLRPNGVKASQTSPQQGGEEFALSQALLNMHINAQKLN